MYQVFCMKGTPPVSLEEQERCFRSKMCCWRLAEERKVGAEPLSTEEAASKAF